MLDEKTFVGLESLLKVPLLDAADRAILRDSYEKWIASSSGKSWNGTENLAADDLPPADQPPIPWKALSALVHNKAPDASVKPPAAKSPIVASEGSAAEVRELAVLGRARTGRCGADKLVADNMQQAGDRMGPLVDPHADPKQQRLDVSDQSRAAEIARENLATAESLLRSNASWFEIERADVEGQDPVRELLALNLHNLLAWQAWPRERRFLGTGEQTNKSAYFESA